MRSLERSPRVKKRKRVRRNLRILLAGLQLVFVIFLTWNISGQDSDSTASEHVEGTPEHESEPEVQGQFLLARSRKILLIR